MREKFKWCPVHDDELWACTIACLPKRRKFSDLCRRYTQYWHERESMKPMSIAQYAARYGRSVEDANARKDVASLIRGMLGKSSVACVNVDGVTYAVSVRAIDQSAKTG